MHDFLNRMEIELKYRSYSPKTLKSYLACLKNFFNFLQTEFSKFDEFKIKQYLVGLKEKGAAGQTVNVHLNAIKFFYENIVKLPFKVEIKFSKKAQRLPVVLSREEIKQIIDSIKNEKHKLMIALSYGAGLRVSEAVKLRVRDIDLSNLQIDIRESKGAKDRITVVPERLKEAIIKFMADRKSVV